MTQVCHNPWHQNYSFVEGPAIPATSNPMLPIQRRTHALADKLSLTVLGLRTEKYFLYNTEM